MQDIKLRYVTVWCTDTSHKGQFSVWAPNDVHFLSDRGSRLLFVTLWPLDKCQAGGNSRGRCHVSLRPWKWLHAGSQIASGPYQWWRFEGRSTRKNVLGQTLIPMLPVRTLVTVNVICLVVLPDYFPATVNSVVSSRSQPLPDFIVVLLIQSSDSAMIQGVLSLVPVTYWRNSAVGTCQFNVDVSNELPTVGTMIITSSVETIPFSFRLHGYWCLSIFSLVDLCFYWRLECIYLQYAYC